MNEPGAYVKSTLSFKTYWSIPLNQLIKKNPASLRSRKTK